MIVVERLGVTVPVASFSAVAKVVVLLLEEEEGEDSLEPTSKTSILSLEPFLAPTTQLSILLPGPISQGKPLQSASSDPSSLTILSPKDG